MTVARANAAWPVVPGIVRVDDGGAAAEIVCVEVLLRESGAQTGVVYSCGRTADEAVGRAEEHARRTLGGDWAMED